MNFEKMTVPAGFSHGSLANALGFDAREEIAGGRAPALARVDSNGVTKPPTVTIGCEM